MAPTFVKTCLFLAVAALVPVASAAPADPPKAEDASAASQYKNLGLTKDPTAAQTGSYKLDPHHTSVIAKLAHMDLSRYTLRFDEISGSFDYTPASSTASNLSITINPGSISTGDATFDKRIATRYLEVDKFPTIHFTADSVRIVGGHATVSGTLEFHGIKKPLVLNTTFRGSAQSRMGFSAEASFKRSDFGVSQWIPLEADEVDVVIETEFVKQ
jgi:polyisoprenoid-binding protein YceI